MYRINAEGTIVARNENKDLEQLLLQAGVRAGALWDLRGLVEAYAAEGMTISDRDAELWFHVCGDRLQEEAARAGEKFVREYIRRDAQNREEYYA